MNFIQFTGHKKTSEKLLDSIRKVSPTQESLLENLSSLKMFYSLDAKKNKIALSEKQNAIKMKVTSSGKKNFSLQFPNILGGGEFLKVDFQGIKDLGFEAGKPLFIKDQLVHAKISANRNIKEINDREIEIRKIDVGAKVSDANVKLGFEKIQKLDVFWCKIMTKLLGFKIDTKIGMTKTEKQIPFLKLVTGKKVAVEGHNLFLEASFKVGKIFGQTSLVEKFFLGDALSGYKKGSVGPVSQNKKIGGNTFIEMRSKAGVYIRNLKLFAFGELGACSVKGLKECGEIIANFGDNNCIGKSIGLGLSMKDRSGPSVLFAVPLTTNPDAEKYYFGIDFEF